MILGSIPGNRWKHDDFYDDFDDDFSMILGQLSNDKNMIKLREIIIFLSFESSFKSSFLGCSLRFP